MASVNVFLGQADEQSERSIVVALENATVIEHEGELTPVARLDSEGARALAEVLLDFAEGL